MRVKSYNSGLEKEFRVPENLSLERKVIWYQNRYREVMLKNSFSQAKKEGFERYRKSLEETVNYIRGIGDYRKLTNEARQVIMFLLSLRKAWDNPKLIREKRVEKVFEFLNADFLPKFKRGIILGFIRGNFDGKPLRDWEIEVLMDEEYNDVERMYRVGREYREIIRLKGMLKRRGYIKQYNKKYYQNHKDKFKHF
jgi:hypothetical protein